MSRRKAVTMEDIGRKLGISTVTVSNALKGRRGVGEELRDQVIKTAAEMGYRMPAGTRGEAEPTFRVAIIWGKLEQPLYMAENMTKQLTREIEKRGGVVTEGPGLADGMIMIGISGKVIWKSHEKMLPAVSIGSPERETAFTSVVTDYFHGMYGMTMELLRKGCQRIAYAGDTDGTTLSLDAYLGYRRAMYQAGVRKEALLILPEDEAALAKALQTLHSLPDAVVCRTLSLAEHLAEILKARGIRIPGRMMIGGLAGEGSSPESRRSVSIIFQEPWQELAEVSVSCLLREIQGQERRPTVVTVQGRLAYTEPAATEKHRKEDKLENQPACTGAAAEDKYEKEDELKNRSSAEESTAAGDHRGTDEMKLRPADEAGGGR